MTDPAIPEPVPPILELVDPQAVADAGSADTDTDTDTDAGATDAPTGRTWPWWTAVAVAVVLLAGAVVWATAARSARDAADADRVSTRGAVTRARHERSAAVASRDDEGDLARDVRLGLAGPLASVEGLVQLTEQGLQADRDAQAVGADPAATTDAAVDVYNEAVTRANVVRDQFDGALARLIEQLRPLDVELPVV